jgi:CPA2 family monovalent cation:H+ antiporter-2
MSDPVVFRDLALVLVAAVAGGALAWWAHQPLILGYVFGGLLISPLTPGVSISDPRTFDLFAEVGVVLLMFSVGIEFSVRDLLRVKRVALLGGPLGMVACAGLGLGVAVVLGWPPLQGVIVGLVTSVASTMVLTRLLLDRGELHSRHGRVMMGISLVEDLGVVILIVLIPALGALEPGRLLAIGLALGKALVILAPFAFLVAKGIPPLMSRVARTHNEELFLLVALAIALGTAALTQAVGLSLALGAFLAGLIISESDYAHETLARMLPLRELFGALFFVTVGALIDPRVLVHSLPTLVAIVFLVVVGKALVRTAIVRVFGESWANAVLVGIGLAQIGEFSFVLVQVARTAGHVGDEIYNATLAASLFTILLNALLTREAPRWLLRAQVAAAEPQGLARPTEWVRGHVVLCGFGRVGSAVGEALETFNIRFVVIELDPDIVKGLNARRVPCMFGDAANRRLLERAGVDRADLVVVTLPEFDRTRRVVREVRQLNATAPLLVRAHHASAIEDLVQGGASEVIQPEMEAAATLIRHALRRLSLPHDPVIAYLERFRATLEPSRPPTAAAGDDLPRVAEVRVERGALADQSLREGRIRERLGVTVVAIVHPDGDLVVNPDAEAIMRPGDVVRVFGLPAQIEAFRREATVV